MILLWPWGLAALAAVAAAAYMALRRPMQQVSEVSSLRLWQRALEALGPAAQRRSPRVSLPWVLLLCGAVAAATAAARPALRQDRPARRVAIAAWSGAEWANLPLPALAEALEPLLGRLAAADQVWLLLPDRPTLRGPMPPAQARQMLQNLPCTPVPAAQLVLPPAPAEVQHVYHVAPAGTDVPRGPAATPIFLPAQPGDYTLDAFAADAADSRVLAAMRNNTDREAVVKANLGGLQREQIQRDWPPGEEVELTIAPAARRAYPTRLSGDVLFCALGTEGGPGSSAWLVRRPKSAASVAVVNGSLDDPLLRRFVQVNPALRLVGDPAEADMVFASGALPPAGKPATRLPGLMAGKPALVIAPPQPPPGWLSAGTARNLTLDRAQARGDSAILAGVNLAGVAVAKAELWAPVAEAAAGPGQVLLAMDDKALIVATDNPRRVYVSFDLAAHNTNLGMQEAYVILLANIVAYLAPAAQPRDTYESVTPLEAGAQPDWKLVRSAGSYERPPAKDLPWPGLYVDPAGNPHAVNLTGLRSAKPAAGPATEAATVPLPEPAPLRQPLELWPALLAAAGALWLAGWASRIR